MKRQRSNLLSLSKSRCHKIADDLGDKVTDWEARWYNAVYSFKLYSPRQACHILMDLLVAYPFDLLAVYIGMFWAFYSVDKFLMRDTIGRVLSYHGQFHPYRNLLDSFYGFALLETCSLEKGAKMVKDAFDNDPDNPWIIHVKCHSLMYGDRFDDALQLMMDKKDCYKNSSLGYHNSWHAADLLIGEFRFTFWYKPYEFWVGALLLVKRPTIVVTFFRKMTELTSNWSSFQIWSNWRYWL